MGMTLLVILVQLRAGWYPVPAHTNSIWDPYMQPFFKYSGGPVPDQPGEVGLTSTGFPEPGVGAIIGAAAFLGGSGRISLFVVVMLVEITGDPVIILPVGIATLLAVVIGNLFNHGLYHTLIDVQSFPFLPDKWHKALPTGTRILDALPDIR